MYSLGDGGKNLEILLYRHNKQPSTLGCFYFCWCGKHFSTSFYKLHRAHTHTNTRRRRYFPRQSERKFQELDPISMRPGFSEKTSDRERSTTLKVSKSLPKRVINAPPLRSIENCTYFFENAMHTYFDTARDIRFRKRARLLAFLSF